MNKLRFAGLVAVLLASLPSGAQFTSPYVILQGSLSTSSGLPAQNATLTFSPSQVFFVAGSSVVVSESQCGTDVSGAVVGIGNPVSGPRVTAQFTGTLTPGNYYVEFAWYDQFGTPTLVSPEVAVQLTATGELQVLPPVGNGPPQAVGMGVYIGTSSGTETLQGQTSSLTAQYTQASALVAGVAPPTRNLTPCRVVANDAGFPTGTGYTVGLLDASGNTLFSYPEMWQFFGPGSTYNLSNGIPYYHGQVTYPIPILTIPYNHNPQSISGPLSLSGYNLYNVASIGVGTALPAWGVDVEGAGLLGIVNANGGYLVNGVAGAVGTCLGSDGTAYDTPINCSTNFYQTVQFNGTSVPQEPFLNFLNPLTVATVGGKTNVGILTTGTELQVVTAAGPSSPGTYAVWDGFGGITGAATAPPFNLTYANQTSSRTVNTVYHNTSAFAIYVTGNANSNTGGSTAHLAFVIGPSSSPTDGIYNQEFGATVANGSLPFTGWVPAGWFYELVPAGDAGWGGSSMWWEATP